MTEHARPNRARALVLAALVVCFAIVATANAVAARRPNPPASSGAASCTLSTAGVGQPLLLTGTGLAADSQYVLYMSSPAGTGATFVNTDSSGSFTYSTWASWAGTYSAELMTESHHSSVAASCSTTVS